MKALLSHDWEALENEHANIKTKSETTQKPDDKIDMVSRGYRNLGGDTQNQGNVIGDRPCVRQTRTGRDHEGGNRMKDILGQSDLKWNIDEAQGAYHGHKVYDTSVKR